MSGRLALPLFGVLAVACASGCTVMAPFEEPEDGGAIPRQSVGPTSDCPCDRGSECVGSCVCDPDCAPRLRDADREPEPESSSDTDTDTDGGADTDMGADAGAGTDTDMDAGAGADARATQCGDGTCERGETGATCTSDCCDEDTPCDATWQDAGAWYCRAMNGGGYWWWTAEDTTAMCDEENELGTGTYECGGGWGTCCALPGGWVEGACS